MIAISKCLLCEQPFTPTQKTQKYCSVKCGSTHRGRKYSSAKRDTINERRRMVVAANRARLAEYLGEYKCEHCGYTNESTAPFDFHHTDPTEKEYNPSNLLACKWEKLQAEIDKCMLLCKNCHAIEHERLRNDCCI